MLIRIIIDNIYSFGKREKLNMLTNKSQRHAHHKRCVAGVQFLRMAAIYGANGAGKSNVIKALDVLRLSVDSGTLARDTASVAFRLYTECRERPSSVAVEFVEDSTMFFYSLSWDATGVLYELLCESGRGRDETLLERSYDEGTRAYPFP